jgi:hypothetical protein
MPILRLLRGSPYDALAIGIMTVAHLRRCAFAASLMGQVQKLNP